MTKWLLDVNKCTFKNVYHFYRFLNDKSLITYFQSIFVKTCTVTSSLLVYETQCELQE